MSLSVKCLGAAGVGWHIQVRATRFVTGGLIVERCDDQVACLSRQPTEPTAFSSTIGNWAGVQRATACSVRW
jgi:hypothetical protein